MDFKIWKVQTFYLDQVKILTNLNLIQKIQPG